MMWWGLSSSKSTETLQIIVIGCSALIDATIHLLTGHYKSLIQHIIANLTYDCWTTNSHLEEQCGGRHMATSGVVIERPLP
jgi:hypothetical protein